MEQILNRRLRWSFFVWIGIIGILATHIGFATTYIQPVLNGRFKAPVVIYLHGALAMAWIVLFLVQAILVQGRHYRAHIALGSLALVLAPGVAFSIVPAGMFQVQRDLAAGLGETAISSLVGAVSSAFIFLLLVVLGLSFRRRPDMHKRFMLLATLVLLWPAWFRFRHYFPGVPRPDIWFAIVLADSLILVAWIWDKYVYGRIHPVLLYGGIFIIAEHVFELLCFDSPGWRQFAHYLYSQLQALP